MQWIMNDMIKIKKITKGDNKTMWDIKCEHIYFIIKNNFLRIF